MRYTNNLFSVLALALLLTLCLAFLAPEAEAAQITASGTCGDNLTWTLDSEGTLTISGTGKMDSYYYSGSNSTLAPWHTIRSYIRAVVIEPGVTDIGSLAFYLCDSLTEITIPDTVTAIGGYGFYGCSSLVSASLPSSVTVIGDNAFYNCFELADITIPDTVTAIGNGAFQGCDSLTSISIPSSVTVISEYAFYSCGRLARVTIPSSVTTIEKMAFAYCDSLTKINIPSSVTHIANAAFSPCSKLTGIWVDEENPNYSSDANGVLFNKHKTILIQVPSGLSGSYAIPNGVVGIQKGAFCYCSRLTEVTIPNSITEIGDSAFKDFTGLTSITIPDSVTSIGYRAFYNCTNLVCVAIPDTVTGIGSCAFDACYKLSHVVYTGTGSQWNSISINSCNTDLTDAKKHCEAAENAVYWTKNCVNRGWYCAICNDFITTELAESGSHTYSGSQDTVCDDCGYVKTPKSVTVSTKPSRLEYPLYTAQPDVTGGVLTATYSDGTAIRIPMTGDMVTGFDGTKLGAQTLTVAYCGKTASYTVTVVYGDPDALTVVTPPQKRDYFTGEAIDLTGLTLTATYTGHDPIAVPVEDVNIAVDMTTAGKKAVTLGLGSASADFEIFVHEKTVQRLDAALYPESSHNYAANTDESKTFTWEGADALTLTFGSGSFTEADFDFLYLYDGEGNEIGKYSGDLSGKVVTVPGDTFRVRLTSDASVNKYGYAFSAIAAETVLHPGQSVPGTAATCTQPGVTAGVPCDICGQVTGQKEIPPLGHSYSGGACTRCGEADPDYDAGKFPLVGANVDLGNDLTMNFFVNKADIPGEGCYVEIVKENEDGSASLTTVAYADFRDYYGIFWQVSLEGMAAKEMADTVRVTVYNAGGTAISETWTDSIRDYCVRQLEKPAMSDAYTLIADMLNYGAAAQTHFGYNVDDLASSTMTPEQAAYATQDLDPDSCTNALVSGKGYVGSSLSLESNIRLTLFFQTPASGGSLKALVSYTDHTGSLQSYEVAQADFTALGDYRGVVIDTLTAPDVRQLVTVSLYDGNNLVGFALDSVESYGARQGGDINTALMKFTLSAYEYLH